MTNGVVGLAIDADGVARADAAGAVVVAPLLAMPGYGVGAAALRLAAGGAVVYRDFTGRVGDPVPVVGSDGSAVSGADLTAAVIGRLVGDRPREVTVMAHPAEWGEHEHASLRAALARARVSMARTSLVPRPVAAATQAMAVGQVRPGDAMLVADIGYRGVELAVVTDVTAGGGRVARVSTSEEFGADDLDHAVLLHMIDLLGGRVDRLAMAEVAARAQAVRRVLHRQPTAVVEVAGRTVRVVRTDIEHVVGAAVSRGADTIAAAHAAPGPEPAVVVLVGEAAATPLLAESLSVRLSVPVVVPPQPEYAVVAGAARTAALRAPQPGPRRPLRPPAPERVRATAPAETAAFVRAALRTPAHRRAGLLGPVAAFLGGRRAVH